MSVVEIKVPDIGDFDAVEIIEVLVSVGDEISANQDVITLESDKAAMEIPSSVAGKVLSVNVAVGEKVKEGSIILTLETTVIEATNKKEQAEAVSKTPENQPKPAEPIVTAAVTSDKDNADIHAEILVLGSGPGGYTAAFRAADLGKQVVMIERHAKIGGVCLNVGCIPSKALLHTALIINEAADIADHGVKFAEPDIDIRKIETWKTSIVDKLTSGLKALAKQRKVTIIQVKLVFRVHIRCKLLLLMAKKQSHLITALSLLVHELLKYRCFRMMILG